MANDVTREEKERRFDEALDKLQRTLEAGGGACHPAASVQRGLGQYSTTKIAVPQRPTYSSTASSMLQDPKRGCSAPGHRIGNKGTDDQSAI